MFSYLLPDKAPVPARLFVVASIYVALAVFCWSEPAAQLFGPSATVVGKSDLGLTIEVDHLSQFYFESAEDVLSRMYGRQVLLLPAPERPNIFLFFLLTVSWLLGFELTLFVTSLTATRVTRALARLAGTFLLCGVPLVAGWMAGPRASLFFLVMFLLGFCLHLFKRPRHWGDSPDYGLLPGQFFYLCALKWTWLGSVLAAAPYGGGPSHVGYLGCVLLVTLIWELMGSHSHREPYERTLRWDLGITLWTWGLVFLVTGAPLIWFDLLTPYWLASLGLAVFTRCAGQPPQAREKVNGSRIAMALLFPTATFALFFGEQLGHEWLPVVVALAAAKALSGGSERAVVTTFPLSKRDEATLLAETVLEDRAFAAECGGTTRLLYQLPKSVQAEIWKRCPANWRSLQNEHLESYFLMCTQIAVEKIRKEFLSEQTLEQALESLRPHLDAEHFLECEDFLSGLGRGARVMNEDGRSIDLPRELLLAYGCSETEPLETLGCLAGTNLQLFLRTLSSICHRYHSFSNHRLSRLASVLSLSPESLAVIQAQLTEEELARLVRAVTMSRPLDLEQTRRATDEVRCCLGLPTRADFRREVREHYLEVPDTYYRYTECRLKDSSRNRKWAWMLLALLGPALCFHQYVKTETKPYSFWRGLPVASAHRFGDSRVAQVGRRWVAVGPSAPRVARNLSHTSGRPVDFIKTRTGFLEHLSWGIWGLGVVAWILLLLPRIRSLERLESARWVPVELGGLCLGSAAAAAVGWIWIPPGPFLIQGLLWWATAKVWGRLTWAPVTPEDGPKPIKLKVLLGRGCLQVGKDRVDQLCLDATADSLEGLRQEFTRREVDPDHVEVAHDYDLSPRTYLIMVGEEAVDEGYLLPQDCLALAPVQSRFKPWPREHIFHPCAPTSPALWVKPGEQERCRRRGYLVRRPTEVLADHVIQVLEGVRACRPA